MSRETNDEIDRLFAYHERTKHTWVSVRSSTHFLDWDLQPSPFRTYEGVPVVELERGGAGVGRADVTRLATLVNLGTRAALTSLASGPGERTMKIDHSLVSTLLWYSVAISGWKQVRGSDFRYSLRVNPSSGNLHPTETHLALPSMPDLEAGLYHYRARDHRLEQRGRGDAISALLATAGARAARAKTVAVVAFTSIFWRESWKYRDRAYRYCLLDLGHAYASLAAAATALGLRADAIGWFDDGALASVLGVEGGDEQPLLLVRVAAAGAVESNASEGFALAGGQPNRLSEDEAAYPLILGMHQSSALDAPLETCPAPRRESKADETGDLEMDVAEMAKSHAVIGDEPLEVTVRRRRSAIDQDPRTSTLTRTQFGAVLHAVCGEWRSDWRGNLAPFSAAADTINEEGAIDLPGERFVSLYLYVHRVEDVAPGLYRLDPAHGLRRLGTGDWRGMAARLSLEQTFAGHAAFAISMIADLERAAQSFGCRAYRFVHAEAGVFGQLLYLAAESIGMQSTGIGAFYDDEVHRFLNLEGRARQVVYHFAVGRAVPDDRLIDVDGPVE